MIVNDQLFDLEDQADVLVNQIAQSQLMKEYKMSKQAFQGSIEASNLLKEFTQYKQDFEKIEAYGLQAPNYREKNRALRQAKRKLDLNDQVAAFRVSETAVQNLLDEICLSVANSISVTIKVDAGNPFFETGGRSGCGGNCHAS